MAKATPIIVTSTRVDSYSLALSIEEAKALYDVIRRVGGHPGLTRRGLIQNIENEFRSVGVPHTSFDVERDLVGSLYFEEV